MDKNKENVPKIRFPGFTCPWEQCKLDEIALKIGDGLHGTPQYSEDGNVYFINGNNLVDGKILTTEDTKKVTEKEQSLDDMALDKNTILMSINGTIGNLALYNGEKLMLGKSASYIRTEKSDRKFLFYALQTKAVRDYFFDNLTGTTIKNLGLKTIRDTKIFFPNRQEQEKIGNIFSNLDNLITLHQRKLEHLQDNKKGLLQKMFPKEGEKFPEIRFPGFADEWEQRKLGEIGETYTGLSGKTKDDFGHGDARFITYMNVFSNPISNFKGVDAIEIDNKQNEVKYGDVLFTTSSETPDEVGMASVWLGNNANTYLNSFCFGYRPTVRFNPYYLAYMLHSPSIRKNFKLLAQGISRYNISKNKTMDMDIYIPSIEEQKLIGVYFYKLDNLITLHERKLEHLQQQKKGLLQQMFV